jgi:multisubunit Na+/H+ antiporter MnhG subunit
MTLGQARDKGHDRLTLAVSLSLFAAAAAILFVRFPPADLSGWIATTLGVTLGVPLLFAAALLILSAQLNSGRRGLRGFRVVTLALSALTAFIGFATLFTAV